MFYDAGVESIHGKIFIGLVKKLMLLRREDKSRCLANKKARRRKIESTALGCLLCRLERVYVDK